MFIRLKSAHIQWNSYNFAKRTLVHRDWRCCKSIGPFVWQFECFVLTGVVAATATIQPPLPLMWLAFIVIVASFCLCTQFDHTFRCAYKDISINKPTFCCAIRSTMRRTFICCIRALTSLSHVFFLSCCLCFFLLLHGQCIKYTSICLFLASRT